MLLWEREAATDEGMVREHEEVEKEEVVGEQRYGGGGRGAEMEEE